MSVRTYDASEVVVSIGGVPMSGYTDGTFVEVARNEPTWTMVVGADGLVTRAKTNNFSGTLTLTLKQSSPSNDVLSGFLNVDELSNTGVVPILIKDLSGNSIFFSAQGWVSQFANATFAKEITDRTWTISLADVDMFVGSNSLTGS
jgi:hypothetical protein